MLTQGIESLEWLISEATGNRSRQQAIVTVAGAVALPSGTILGKITATGKFVKRSAAAVDGSQTAAAVLGTALPDTNGDHQALIFDGECEADGAMLDGGVAPVTAVKTELAAIRIKVR